MVLLSRKQQFSGKLEDEEGVLETLAAADAKTIVFDPKFKSDPEKHEGDPARTHGAAQPQLIGKIPANMSLKVRLRGSGTATTDPDWLKYLKACGFASSLLKSINIGAITSGPFVHGETITGGTSGAQGVVAFRTVNGATKIYYTVVGTVEFQSGEVITGGTSGATATTSSSPSSVGRAIKPTLTSIPSLSMGFNQDGFFEQLRGGRGTFKFSLPSAGPGIFDFNFQGVDAGHADETFFENVDPEDTVPPVFKSGSILLDSYTPKFVNLEFDEGGQLEQQDDPTDEKGLLSYVFTARKITGTLTIQMPTAAVYDLVTKYKAATEIILDLTIGTVSGNMFRLYFSRFQIIDLDKSDKGGIVQVALQFQANGSMDKDDEFFMAQL